MNKIILVLPVGRDFRLLPRCLEHYQSLGVEHIFLNVHARPEWGSDLVNRIQEIGHQYDATIGHVHHHVYTESNRTTRIILDHYAAPDDWIIYSDVDEFQEYPDSLCNIIKHCEENGYDFVRGFLLDRVAMDGSLPMLNDRSLHEQFPVGAQITSVIRRGSPDKIVLSRAGIPLGPGQHFTEGGNGVPVQTLSVTVHHFRWDSEAPANLAYMKKMLDTIGETWGVEHQRVLTHLDQNDGKFNLSDPKLMVHYPSNPKRINDIVSASLPEHVEKIAGNSILCRYKDDVLEKGENGDFSVLRYGSKFSQMNISAAMIWALCDGERTVDELVSDLAHENDLKAVDIQGEVFAALKALASKYVLRLLPTIKQSGHHGWNACQQTEFLRTLDYQSHPELYRDVDLCHGLLTMVKDREYPQKTGFHFYWRELKSRFGEKQVATLTACLATQNLDQVNVVLWYEGGDEPDHPELKKLVSGGYIQVKKYDPYELAVGTPLEGNHERLGLRDEKCYLDGDLFRLLVLFRYGGVYVDMDVLLLRDLSPLLTFEFMYSWGGDQPTLMNGAVMRFFPGSVALDSMLTIIKESEPIPESTSWGAGIYGRVRSRYHFTVLPYGFFNPEWTHFDGNKHDYAENPETFMTANEFSRNIYQNAFAWHWHNKWDHEVEIGSKFDLLSNMLTRSWQDKKLYLDYCRDR